MNRMVAGFTTIAAALVLVLIILGAVGYALLLGTVHQAETQWCDSLAASTSFVPAKPGDPGKTPAREELYIEYKANLALEKKFGCR